MQANFKRVATDEEGYDPAQVDEMIGLARTQFADPSSRVLRAAVLRTSQFRLVKGGYEIGAVDAALDRLDDAFAANEAKRLLAKRGHQGAQLHLDEMKKLILGRIDRPKSHRFDAASLFHKGYSKRQVDAVADLIAQALNGENELAISYLRQVVFSPRWGGYQENQVDAYIDKAVEFLQLSRGIL